MSLYGKLAGALLSLGLIGGSAAYVAGVGSSVMAQAQSVADDVSRCYVIGEYNGYPALFEDGSDEPIAVYHTPMEKINTADAALLRDGVRLRGMTEVARLLEDLEIE